MMPSDGPSTAPSAPPPTSAGAARPPRAAFFSPRLALLAALIYNPAILIAYLLYQYGPGTACVAGSLCSFGSAPPPLQALLILLGCVLLWLGLYALVYRAVAASGPKSAVIEWLRGLSSYNATADLLRAYGLVLLVGLLAALLTRHVSVAAVVLGGFGVVVCLACAGAARGDQATGGSA
ncbi:MAG: hypothetical protein ACHQ4H_01960 [Ktedonobacterales bacterium]